ncbi:nucleoside phosphorylase domain-containing protein [Xylaria digitata]|nr:nucleoside phosphorylase domain-containing protein [Xylaria digitata]
MAPLRHKDYTVGWVCVLPIEFAASIKLLEEKHQSLPQRNGDSNSYALGCISDHNVVIVSRPVTEASASPISAAVVVENLVSAFPHIRFILLVGVGSGVPSLKADIRLGDVVVGTPGRKHEGVIQYYVGGTGAEEIFQHTGSPNLPPNILLGAMARLRTDETLGEGDFAGLLRKLSNQASLRETRRDVLFSPTYNHVGGSSCDSCDNTYSIERTPRPNNGPVAHYGLIASVNAIIKDTVARDRLASEIGGVICFEAEAAGMNNDLPCLTIRGIADYGDSHKNELWLWYAALAAASYAAWLLVYTPTV